MNQEELTQSHHVLAHYDPLHTQSPTSNRLPASFWPWRAEERYFYLKGGMEEESSEQLSSS